MSTQLGRFEDVQVGVRLKIASLWIAMLFPFAYGDIFGEMVAASQGLGFKVRVMKSR